jgi:hypothetical protein
VSRYTRRVIPAVLALLVFASPLEGGVGPRSPSTLVPTPAAGNPGSNPDSLAAPIPVAQAMRARGEIQIDGRLDDDAWVNAPVASGFIQQEPFEGRPADVDTEVRILFDGDALYVGARMWDPEPGTIAAQVVRRDEQGQFDRFAVYLDPNLDRRTGYVFQVSAANVQADRYLYNDEREDSAWNAVWASQVTRDADGWVAEMRIPLSQIRYESGSEPQTWGVNFERRRVSSNERTYFSLESRLRRGKVSQFGRLEGMEVPGRARRMEVRPYALSALESGPAEEGDPFFDGRDTRAQMGLDFRWGLTSSFTLDATVNPDFGQVEADPAVINLTAFETFFEERRPFFVEDARVFDFNLSGRRNSLFYSRRIGRNPHGGEPDGAEFSEIPLTAKILGAAKLTGRTSGGLSVGGLFAVTNEESGRAFFPETGETGRFMVEPQSEFGVVRVQQDLRGGDSQIGGIVTAMRRQLPSSGDFDFLAGSAYSGGLDFEHTWNNRNYAVSGFFGASHIRGDSTALIRVQRASNHYFQRPDAAWVEMDSTATYLTGAEWRLEVEKRGGDHFTWAVWVGEATPGLEVNDLGFSTNFEKLDAGFRVGYREIQPGRIFRDYRVTFFSFHNWSHEALNEVLSWSSWGDAHRSGSVSLNWNNTFLNYWGLDVNTRYSPNLYSYTDTRGGPVMASPAQTSVTVRLNSDRRKAFSFDPDLEFGQDLEGPGKRLSVGLGMNWRPSTRVELRFDPKYSRSTDGAQYVTSSSAVPYDPTYGSRYLFAELDRESVSANTRLNVSFSPTLTLELYAQALLSAGDYLTYKQLGQARSYDFREFESGEYGEDDDGVLCTGGDICLGPDGDQHVDFDGDGRADDSFSDRDFNFRSLIGNTVLRWEYRPGSTIFLVWQHRRNDREDFGDFEFDRDFGALWGLRSENLFMIKVNYWLGF